MLPASVLRPRVLVAVGVLPQVLLFVLNWQAWDLARGEMNAGERAVALVIFCLEILSILVPVGLAGRLFLRKTSFSRVQGVLPVTAGAIYLAAVFVLSSRAIPDAVADWMLPPGRWMGSQFALVVPVMLFGALRLLCPDEADGGDRPGGWRNPLALASILLAGSLGYLFAFAFFGVFLFRFSTPRPLFEILMPAGYMGLSILAAAAVMRLSIGVYLWVRARSLSKLMMLCFFVAWLFPLAGLLLNAGIPFPADFQMPAIYVLAVANGLVVMLPNFAAIFWQRVVWLLQCLFFPFTVYFFAVFLPVLPLAPLGMLCFGLGLFLYVPALLFLLHGYRIWDGFHLAVRDGRRLPLLMAGVVAVLAWPVGYTVSARMDRAGLHSALDYLQYPDYARDAKFSGRLTELHSALLHLRDFKEGLYLPYLSEYYNWLVFDGMVLPKSRLNETYAAFFGGPLPKSTLKLPMDWFATRNARGTVTENLNGTDGDRPTTNAVLRHSEVKTVAEGGVSRSRLSLTVFNPTSAVTEYRTLIRVPPGAVVSGLSLLIGAENVPGRLFEKRAAMWVYQKITEARPIPKDPAVLRFVGPGIAELRVYPVASGEERHVEVEFLTPQGWVPDFGAGLEEIDFKAGSQSLIASDAGGFSLVLPEEMVRGLPSLNRTPRLHFLVDCSKDSQFRDVRKLKEAMVRAARTCPTAKFARMTFVNFETGSFRNGERVPVENLDRLAIDDSALPDFRGGFLPTPAIKQVLWQDHLEMAEGKEHALREYPRIVVLQGSSQAPLSEQNPNLPEFSRLLPDLPGYWVLKPGVEQPVFVGFCGESQEPAQVPVTIIRADRICFATPAGRSVCYSSVGEESPVPGNLGVYQPLTGEFAVFKNSMKSSAEYARALVPWSLEMSRIFEPSQNRGNEPLKRLVKLCRAMGTLVPSLAYMVVEDTSQWKMLERTEKKTLNGHEALGLSENTPEPGTLALVILGLALVFGRSLRVRFFQ